MDEYEPMLYIVVIGKLLIIHKINELGYICLRKFQLEGIASNSHRLGLRFSHREGALLAVLD